MPLINYFIDNGVEDDKIKDSSRVYELEMDSEMPGDRLFGSMPVTPRNEFPAQNEVAMPISEETHTAPVSDKESETEAEMILEPQSRPGLATRAGHLNSPIQIPSSSPFADVEELFSERVIGEGTTLDTL